MPRNCSSSLGKPVITEFVWQESIKNQLQMEGWSQVPMVSTTPLKFPHFSSRETEVLVMSLFYKNNVLNSFLFTLDRLKWPSPYCSCDHEEQTAIHVLTSCSHVDEDLRDQASYLLSVGNEVSSLEDLGTPHLAILNCSRDPKFIEICSECVNNDELKLRRKICISTGPTHA